jgi:hypothetical protein
MRFGWYVKEFRSSYVMWCEFDQKLSRYLESVSCFKKLSECNRFWICGQFYNMSSPPGVKFGPWGRSWPLGMKFSLEEWRGEQRIFIPRGQSLPLGANLTPRGLGHLNFSSNFIGSAPPGLLRHSDQRSLCPGVVDPAELKFWVRRPLRIRAGTNEPYGCT